MKKYLAALFSLLLCQLLPLESKGQQFYKIKADFSIKEKLADGTSQLIMGEVYYDKVVKKIVYNITFPEPETWVIQDTVFYRLKGQQVVDKTKSFLAPNSSVFHFALTGQLPDYGLKNSPYKVEQVEKEGSMIISTWKPDASINQIFGKVVLSNVHKKLNGIVFYNPAGEILSKQIYQDYLNVNGCEFPTKVTQITYLKTGSNYQVTIYKNIAINQDGEENIYNFVIPE